MSDGEFWEDMQHQRDMRKAIESRSKRLTPPLQGQSKRVLKESDSSEPLAVFDWCGYCGQQKEVTITPDKDLICATCLEENPKKYGTYEAINGGIANVLLGKMYKMKKDLKELIDFHGMGEEGTAQRGMYNHIRGIIEPSP